MYYYGDYEMSILVKKDVKNPLYTRSLFSMVCFDLFGNHCLQFSRHVAPLHPTCHSFLCTYSILADQNSYMDLHGVDAHHGLAALLSALRAS